MALTHNPYKFQNPRLRYGPKDWSPEDWFEYDLGPNWTLSAGEKGIGETFEFTLNLPEDLDHFIGPDTRCDFSIGRRSSLGVWTSPVILSGYMRFAQSRSQISFGQTGPTDQITVTLESMHNAKIESTPELDLIIYDPATETIDETTLEPITDSRGGFYYPEVVRKPGLSMHYLFQEIFVDRCGFAAFRTNIPDYKIKRYDCSAGSSYYSALVGYIGMWEPLLYTEGNVLWIVDTSMVSPSNLPSGRPFTPKAYRNVSDTDARDRIGGLVLQYIELAAQWDYYTTATDDPEVTSTDTTSTSVVRTYREYRKRSLPFVIQRRALDKEVTTVRQGDPVFGDIVEEITNDLRYDYVGRISSRVRTADSLLPSPAGIFSMQRSETEIETYTYAQHPFKQRQIYVKEKKYTRTGLMVWNEEDTYLDGPFKQTLKDAHRSGNLKWSLLATGGAVRELPIESRIETARPLRSGDVRVTVIERDELANVVTKQYTEERAGDIGLSTLSPSQQRMYVYPETPLDAETNSRLDTFHIGEVPLAVGLPLAVRVLKQRMASNGQIEMEGIGFDRAMKIGGLISLYGRRTMEDIDGTPEYKGDYLVTGFRLVGSAGAIAATYSGKKV